MQNILVVKNDDLFLNTISERLVLNDNVSFLDRLGHSIPEGFFELEVYKATNGQQAIKTLGQYPIDIVITDLKMPKINGLELIVYMNGHFPNTPIIVMTDIAPISMNKVLDQDGISHYIERPFSIEAIKKSVMEVLIVKLLNPEKEVYSSISVTSIMQLITTSKLTYTVYLKFGERVGRIYFLYGKLIGAETERNTGEDAIYELLGWKNPIILLEPTCNNVDDSIKVSLVHILKKSIKALHGFGTIDSSKLLKRSALPPNEKSTELKRLYRSLAKKFHPDQNDYFTEEIKDYWLLIMNAYNKGEIENLKILSLITSSLTESKTFQELRGEDEEESFVQEDKRSEVEELEPEPEKQEPLEEETQDIRSEEDQEKTPDSEEESKETKGNKTNQEKQKTRESEVKEQAEIKTETEPEIEPEPEKKDRKQSSKREETKVDSHKKEFKIDKDKATEILTELYSVKGFLATGILSPAGSLEVTASEIEKWAPDTISIELRKIMDKIKLLTDSMKFKKPQEINLAGSNGSILIESLAWEEVDKPYIFVLLDSEGNMALTKIAIRKLMPKLIKTIEIK